MTTDNLRQILGPIKERLAALEVSQGPRTGGLKQSPGRRIESQMEGILNRLDALEGRLAKLEERMAFVLRIPPPDTVVLIGTGHRPVPDDSSDL